jgi:DNA-binding NarL/FixJ family response regulator
MDHAGPASELARVRLLAARAAVNVVGSESAAAMLHDALGHALPDELRAEALNALARLRWYDRDAAAVEAAATDALAVSRSLGSVPGQVAALCSLSEAASLLSDLESARHHADQALALVRRHGLAAAPAELALGTALVSSGSFAEGLPLLTASLLSAELDGDPAAMALPQIVLQGSRFHTGDWDDFVADADAMVAIGRDTGVRSGIVFPLGLAALVATRREPHAVRSLHARLRAEQTVGDAHPGSVVGALLGELAELEVAGRTGDAARAAVSLVELLGPTGFTAQALVLMEAVRLAWEVGDSESLTTLRNIAAAGAARSPTATRTAIASFCETLLGAAAEDVASAAAGIAATERTWDGAVALHIAGLIARDARQSHASSALLREATIRYRSLGAGQYAASAESRRGFAGVFVGEPIGAMATHDTAAALSGAERKVLRLVASGMSNGEIAAELFVSKRTVESHVGALYRKLGVSTRVALAAVQSSQA